MTIYTLLPLQEVNYFITGVYIMSELNVFEMQEISGGYSWDTSSFMSTLTSLVTNGV
ncbi:hypothetical protein ACOIFA_32815, partial [Klebsiella pneumoniae]